MQHAAVIALGLVAGTLSSLLGIGGGIILVPGMIYLLDMPIKQAVGTSLAIILPTALVGVFRHWTYGNVNWKAGLLIMIGSVIGAYLGAWLSTMIPGPVLKKIFAIFVVLVAIKLWRG